MEDEKNKNLSEVEDFKAPETGDEQQEEKDYKKEIESIPVAEWQRTEENITDVTYRSGSYEVRKFYTVGAASDGAEASGPLFDLSVDGKRVDYAHGHSISKLKSWPERLFEQLEKNQ